MAMAGLYRRILPSPPAIDFASSEGKQLFVEGIQNGTMEGFFKLISYFQTQSETAYCGLASLSMVLNALAIDPGRKWKGPWRWFDESMLDCCEPLEKVKANGISFGKVACLACCAGAEVVAFHTNQSTVDDFRKYVRACSTSDNCHVISSYHRGTFQQTGTGHFSPIGGYHAERDMALILDVARFKYPPHWVPLSLLWEAMNTVDEETGLQRGFMLISRLQRAPGLLYTLSCKHESWVSIAKYLTEEVPLMLKSDTVKGIEDVISMIFSSLPPNFADFINWVAEVRRQEDASENLSEEERGRLAMKEEVLKQVQETGLYKHVTDLLSVGASICRIKPTLCHMDNLPNIAARVCCQGAGLLAGKTGSSDRFCCRETCVRSYRANGDRTVTVVSGKVVGGNGQQEIDMLVPSLAKNCCNSSLDSCQGMHPDSNDILTALLLALPPETWLGIREEKVLQEICSLLSTENLPLMLQEEVLHLRNQLLCLKRCNDKVVLQDARDPSQSLQLVIKEDRVVSQRLCSSSKQIPSWKNARAVTFSCSLPLLSERGIPYRGKSRKESLYPINFLARVRYLNNVPNSAFHLPLYGFKF
ncbi:glutathione gamma-glutamylcysteinyltransferase 1 isoform X1 [Coffea arabica]|uniref:glutathione gamma-glutamylcysteinyltransferase n=2 Tax=Coffea arabica TaxID=13443 RepID=A0A6P6UV91_COFAR